MVVGTSVIKWTFEGLEVSCSCSSLEERSVTIPWMEGQRDRHYMSSNAELACQKWNQTTSPQTEIPRGKRVEPLKKVMQEAPQL